MPGEDNVAENVNQPKTDREKKVEANKNLQKKAKSLDKPRSSLPLQILLYFDWYFSVFFGIVTIILLFYKTYGLPYPSAVWELEFVFLLLFWAWQMIKIFLGSKGNKTEHATTTLFFVILNIPSIFAYVFFLRLQTYVLVLEVVINAIGIFF